VFGPGCVEERVEVVDGKPIEGFFMRDALYGSPMHAKPSIKLARNKVEGRLKVSAQLLETGLHLNILKP
jgi:hypothetical protein